VQEKAIELFRGIQRPKKSKNSNIIPDSIDQMRTITKDIIFWLLGVKKLRALNSLWNYICLLAIAAF
jgi:hypothetical protein